MGTIEAYVAHMEDGPGDGLRALLAALPPELSSRGRVFALKEGAVLLRAQEEATHIYFLLAGSVTGVDEMESGSLYSFASFAPPAIFGEYEAFADSPVYRGTLICACDCTLAVLPRGAYLAWVQANAAILFTRTRQIVRQLVDQTGAERTYLFLSGVERVSLYLCRAWEKSGSGGLLCFCPTRQQMADEMGLSIKTIQRALLQFRKDGLISTCGRTMTISKDQYRRLRLLCKRMLP